jgi:hypothetical protein
LEWTTDSIFSVDQSLLIVLGTESHTSGQFVLQNQKPKILADRGPGFDRWQKKFAEKNQRVTMLENNRVWGSVTGKDVLLDVVLFAFCSNAKDRRKPSKPWINRLALKR